MFMKMSPPRYMAQRPTTRSASHDTGGGYEGDDHAARALMDLLVEPRRAVEVLTREVLPDGSTHTYLFEAHLGMPGGGPLRGVRFPCVVRGCA